MILSLSLSRGLLMLVAVAASASAFSILPPSTFASSRTRLCSSTGGGDLPPPNDGRGDEGGGLGDFFNPKEESENMKKAREYMSEESLPINFDMDENDPDDDQSGKDIFGKKRPKVRKSSDSDESAITFGSPSGQFFPNTPSKDVLAKNPYLSVVSKLSPSDIISKFTSTAHPRVQDAVRNTILGLIGNLPQMAFDTTTITTGQRLASLMFQLQMTGYMFKNAEYRLSLSQSLEEMSHVERNRNGLLLSGDSSDEEEEALLQGKIRGKLKIRYGGRSLPKMKEKEEEEEGTTSGVEMEVDADAYMSELRSEVSKLRDELDKKRQEKDEAIRKDLLLYIRTLPRQELQSLTNTMTADVLVGMKGLVQAVLAGIGDDQIAPDTVTEQSGEAMAQLCMWQLAVGYNLRELEVREEMKKQLNGGKAPTSDAQDGGGAGGVDFSDPDAMQ